MQHLHDRPGANLTGVVVTPICLCTSSLTLDIWCHVQVRGAGQERCKEAVARSDVFTLPHCCKGLLLMGAIALCAVHLQRQA